MIRPSLLLSALRRLATPARSPAAAPAPLWGSGDNAAFAPFLAALLYLLLPSATVLWYFAPWRGATLGAGCLALLWAWGGRTGPWLPARPALLATWPYLALAAAIVALSGALPPFAENLDWYKHYAMFNTLEQQAWPPQTITPLGIATLRYYLSYYVPPVLAAKLLGGAVLPAAVFAWTTLGLYLALALAFGGKTRPAASAFLVGCIVLLFSGADIVGTKLTGNALGPAMHFEWWWPLGALCATITNLFWAPQHAVPALLATFLLLRYPRDSLAHAGVLAAATALWSPFAAIGLAPLLLWACLRLGLRPLLSRSNLLAAPLLLLATARYLGEGTAGIPVDLIWEYNDFHVSGWLLFLLLEFGALGLGLLLVAPRTLLPVTLCALFLGTLALFHVGNGNDLLMRASIPALGLLAYLSACAVADAPNTLRKAPLIVCLVAGLATPLGEIMRALVAQRIAHPERITLDDITHGDPAYEQQYRVFKRADNAVRTEVADLDALHLAPYGEAAFDLARHSVASAAPSDAGFVSDTITLPPGVYKIEAVLDWDVAGAAPDRNAAHLSLYGDRILLPIPASAERDHAFNYYLRVDGKPFRLAFGLGGWALGKGRITLKQLRLGLVKPLPR